MDSATRMDYRAKRRRDANDGGRDFDGDGGDGGNEDDGSVDAGNEQDEQPALPRQSRLGARKIVRARSRMPGSSALPPTAGLFSGVALVPSGAAQQPPNSSALWGASTGFPSFGVTLPSVTGGGSHAAKPAPTLSQSVEVAAPAPAPAAAPQQQPTRPVPSTASIIAQAQSMLQSNSGFGLAPFDSTLLPSRNPAPAVAAATPASVATSSIDEPRSGRALSAAAVEAPRAVPDWTHATTHRYRAGTVDVARIFTRHGSGAGPASTPAQHSSPPAATATVAAPRRELYTRSVAALNAEFARFVAGAAAARPVTSLQSACKAYIEHIAVLRRACGGDVGLVEHERQAPPSAVASSPLALNAQQQPSTDHATSGEQQQRLRREPEGGATPASAVPAPASAVPAPNRAEGSGGPQTFPGALPKPLAAADGDAVAPGHSAAPAAAPFNFLGPFFGSSHASMAAREGTSQAATPPASVIAQHRDATATAAAAAADKPPPTAVFNFNVPASLPPPTVAAAARASEPEPPAATAPSATAPLPAAAIFSFAPAPAVVAAPPVTAPAAAPGAAPPKPLFSFGSAAAPSFSFGGDSSSSSSSDGGALDPLAAPVNALSLPQPPPPVFAFSGASTAAPSTAPPFGSLPAPALAEVDAPSVAAATAAPPAFSFGAPAATAPSVPSFSFGAPAAAAPPAPAFSFGAPAAAAPAGVPAFTCNPPAVADPVPAFSFGAPAAVATASAPAFSFGAPAPAAPAAPAFSFGAPAPAAPSVPSFSFGAPAAVAPAPAFSFGAPAAAAPAAAFSFGAPAAAAPAAAFSFGAPAAAGSTPAFSFNAAGSSSSQTAGGLFAGFGTPASAAGAASVAADGGGGGDDDGGAADETELVTSAPAAGEPPVPLLPGETIALTEPRAKLLRWKTEDKSWADLGIATLRVTRGEEGARGRVVFSSATGTREKVVLAAALYAGAPPPLRGAVTDPTKAAGIAFQAMWAAPGASDPRITRFSVRVKTAAQEAAIEAALKQ